MRAAFSFIVLSQCSTVSSGSLLRVALLAEPPRSRSRFSLLAPLLLPDDSPFVAVKTQSETVFNFIYSGFKTCFAPSTKARLKVLCAKHISNRDFGAILIKGEVIIWRTWAGLDGLDEVDLASEAFHAVEGCWSGAVVLVAYNGFDQPTVPLLAVVHVPALTHICRSHINFAPQAQRFTELCVEQHTWR